MVVRSGPVAGQVVIGDGYSTYRRPVAYRRPVERVIVVERVRHSRHGNARHWQQRGYRQVVVYYRDGRYYDRYVRGGPAMRQVVVYERDGRYYRAMSASGTIVQGRTATTTAAGTTDLPARLPAPDRPDPGRLQDQTSPLMAGMSAFAGVC